MYALYLMALHPAVQDTFHDELIRGRGSNEPSFQNICDLVYALCITYETMRLFPFVGSLPHLLQSDQVLIGKYKIPRGTNIALDWVNVQRNEKYWGPTANEFDPSRFLEMDEKGGRLKVLPKGYFIGFSEGPRACLGKLPFCRCRRLMGRETICGNRDYDAFGYDCAKVYDTFERGVDKGTSLGWASCQCTDYHDPTSIPNPTSLQEEMKCT